jgi:hypothetical protein
MLYMFTCLHESLIACREDSLKVLANTLSAELNVNQRPKKCEAIKKVMNEKDAGFEQEIKEMFLSNLR